MQLPHSAILTVVCSEKNFINDMELPTLIEINELEILLLESLKMLNSNLFYKVSAIGIEYNRQLLSSNQTLASVSAFDGSTIKIIIKQQQ